MRWIRLTWWLPLWAALAAVPGWAREAPPPQPAALDTALVLPAPVAASAPAGPASGAEATAVSPAAGPDAAAGPPAPTGLPLPYAAAVAARFPDPPVPYPVPALLPGRVWPTTQAELSAWLDDTVRRAVPGLRIDRLTPGASQSGVPIEALRFSRGPGRPMALLVAQQHGDEPAGAEALLVLARELAEGALAPVLDRLDLVLVPRLNPDGALAGRRQAANGLDINRDHLLLRTPEARALAALVRWQRPVLVIDLHEYTVLGHYLARLGAVQRFDLLYQHATVANLAPAWAEVSEAWFHRPIRAALAAEGHSTEWYYTNPMPAPRRRVSMGGVQADVGRNVYGLRHAVSLLLETRGIGLGHWHLGRRIHSHVVALRTVLRQAARHADGLQTLQARADAEVAALACRGTLVVAAETTPGERSLLMLDPETGEDRPVPVRWDSALALRTVRERPRPCGYWLAADQTVAVATLQALGVQVWPLAEPRRAATEAYVEGLDNDRSGPDARGAPPGDRPRGPRLTVGLRAEEAELPAGSWLVPLDQPLAHLAAAALEPDAPGSYRAAALIDRTDAVRRVMVPLAAP